MVDVADGQKGGLVGRPFIRGVLLDKRPSLAANIGSELIGHPVKESATRNEENEIKLLLQHDE